MQFRSLYEQELHDLQREAFHMGNLVSEFLIDVLQACHRRDFMAIQRAYDKDEEARHMRMAFNGQALKVIATQNPLAADLRKLLFLIHMSDELGRIAAQTVGIGHTGMQQMDGKVLMFEDIYRMGDKAAMMLDQMLSAAASGDEETICRVIEMDDDVDVLYEQLNRECTARLNQPGEEEKGALLGTYKMAKRLELIADSVVNASRWYLYFNADREKYKELLI